MPGLLESEQACIGDFFEQGGGQYRRDKGIMLTPDEQGGGQNGCEVVSYVFAEDVLGRSHKRHGTHAQGIMHEDGPEAGCSVKRGAHKRRQASQQGALEWDSGGSNQDETTYKLGMMRCNPEAHVASHGVAYQVRLLHANGFHPAQEPGYSFGQGEGTVVATHCSEARQVDEVYAIVVREGRDVARPPVGGTGKAVYEDDRVPLSYDLIVNRIAVDVDVMSGSFDTMLLSTIIGGHAGLHR
jgi:hypothetical protein